MLREIKEIKKDNYCCLTDNGVYHLTLNNVFKRWEWQPWNNYINNIKNARKVYDFDLQDFPTLKDIETQLNKYF